MSALTRAWHTGAARIPRAMSRSQLVVRAGGGCVLVLASAVAGCPLWLGVLMVVAALWAIAVPEPSGTAAVTVAFIGVAVVANLSPSSWRALLLALALLLDHACLVAATSAPPRAPLPRALLVRVARRAGVVAVAVVAVWLVAGVLPRGGVTPLPVIVLALLGMLVTVVLLRTTP